MRWYRSNFPLVGMVVVACLLLAGCGPSDELAQPELAPTTLRWVTWETNNPAESLLIGLDLEGIAVSSGSACSSGTLEPSHVLKAMGLPHARTLGSIRFSLGAANTEAEIDRVIAVLPGLVEKLRSLTVAMRR